MSALPDQDAPNFMVYVDGEGLPQKYVDNISSLKFNDTVDSISKIEIDIKNTDELNVDGSFLDETLFQPGHELEIWFGYGDDLKFIARGETIRHAPHFNESGARSVTVVAYDRLWRFKKQQLRISSGTSPRKLANEPASNYDGTVGGWLALIARKYGLGLEVSEAFKTEPFKFTQRKGQNDLEALTATANYYYATIKAEYRYASKTWYLVFRHLSEEAAQAAIYRLTYNEWRRSTLFNLHFEFAIDELVGEIKAYVWNPRAEARRTSATQSLARPVVVGGWEAISEEPYTHAEVQEAVAQRSIERQEAASQASLPPPQMTAVKIRTKTNDPFHGLASRKSRAASGEPIPQKLRLEVGGYSIQIVTRPFRDGNDARKFIKNWMARNRDNFISVRGSFVGLPLCAGQVHRLEGDLLGKTYSGRYYFVDVTHKFTPATGWRVDFGARKIIEGDKPIAGLPQTGASRPAVMRPTTPTEIKA